MYTYKVKKTSSAELALQKKNHSITHRIHETGIHIRYAYIYQPIKIKPFHVGKYTKLVPWESYGLDVDPPPAWWYYRTWWWRPGDPGQRFDKISVGNGYKTWLFRVYRGWQTTQLYSDYNKPLQGSLLNNQLVGGWTNPFETYDSIWILSPIFGVEKKNNLKQPPSKWM